MQHIPHPPRWARRAPGAILRAMPVARLAPLLLLCLPMADSAARPATPQWRDGWGLTAQALPASTDTASTTLQLRPYGQQLQAWVEHAGHGQHLLRLRSRDADGHLIVQRLLTGPGRQLLATLPPAAAHTLVLDTLPGRPRSSLVRHDYALPFDPAAGVRVHQGAHGSASHHDAQNRHAWDFALGEGSVVLAARSGLVMATHGSACCPTRQPGDGGNWVRVEHDDGSMAIYAHLRPRSLQVRAGQRVLAGQPLAQVGNTGYSTAAHLHFAVQLNDGVALRSIPVHMNGPQGRLQAASASALP